MLDYFFFFFCLLSTINIQIKGIDDFFRDYMALDNTNSIKGIFVWMIIFCHKMEYLNKKNYIYIRLIKNLGQNIVSMFLFYSGYVIYESLKKKGTNYSSTLLVKAIILFLESQIIIILFLIANIFILKNKIELKKYLLAIIFKKSIGNSNWFSFTIIAFYLYTYLSFRFIKQIQIGIIIISFICLLHVILVYNYFYIKRMNAIETTLCFIGGFFYSSTHNNFDKIIMKSDIYYFGILSIIICIYYKFYWSYEILNRSIRNLSFALLVLLFSMKIKLKNDFLKFLNSHSYSIYIIQRLIMIIIYKTNILINNNFIQISFEFISIFFFASIFDRYIYYIYKLFKKNSIKFGMNGYNIIENVYINNKGNWNFFELAK